MSIIQRPTSLRRLACAIAAVAVLGGCGSTVQQTARRQVIGGGGDGLGAASSAEPDASLGSNRAVAPAATGPASSSAAAAAGTANAAGSRIQGAKAAATNGPGVTDTTITIGVAYYQSAAAANAAIGAAHVDTGDPVAATRLLVDDINRRGGVAGRKLELLLYAVDPQSAQPYAAEGQAACTYFTQDHQVLAVIDGAPAADERACLEKRGVAYFGVGLAKNTLYSNEIDVYTAGLTRVYGALVPALAERGWFSPWDRSTGRPGATRAKTGIVTVDDPRENAIIDGVLVKNLQKAGYPPAPGDVIRITPPGGFSDDGAVAAQIQNAVLKLNSDGVDHVILDDANGSLALLFNNAANSQHYLPRYGGTTGNGWQVLLSARDIPAATLAGAIGIGWQPLFDLPYAGGDGPYSNPSRHRCLALFAANAMGATDAASAGGQAEACDVAYFLPTALAADKHKPVNLGVLLQRANAIGTSYELASGLGSRFADDQHDGAAGFAVMEFHADCTCVAYVSGVRKFG